MWRGIWKVFVKFLITKQGLRRQAKPRKKKSGGATRGHTIPHTHARSTKVDCTTAHHSSVVASTSVSAPSSRLLFIFELSLSWAEREPWASHTHTVTHARKIIISSCPVGGGEKKKRLFSESEQGKMKNKQVHSIMEKLGPREPDCAGDVAVPEKPCVRSGHMRAAKSRWVGEGWVSDAAKTRAVTMHGRRWWWWKQKMEPPTHQSPVTAHYEAHSSNTITGDMWSQWGIVSVSNQTTTTTSRAAWAGGKRSGVSY